MTLLAVTTTELLKQTQEYDLTAIMAQIFQTGIFSFLVTWIYKMFSKMNTSLKEEVAELRLEVIKLKESENKWFKKYHILSNIIVRKSCRNKDCLVMQAYNEHLEKDGEI